MSTQNMVRPLCLGTSGSVRVTRMPKSENCAPEVHTFWPLMIQSPDPSGARTALVRAAATSDPPEGSENSWHQISSPRMAGPTKRCLSTSLPALMIVGTHMPRPIWNGLPGVGNLASSWLNTCACQLAPPTPPHSLGQVMQE